MQECVAVVISHRCELLEDFLASQFQNRETDTPSADKMLRTVVNASFGGGKKSFASGNNSSVLPSKAARAVQ
jgi:hypothetical protein